MSVRFFKIFSGVLVAHLVVLSLIWVGFSAPAPRPPAAFVYEGTLPADEAETPVGGQADTSTDQIILNHLDGNKPDEWVSLRNSSR